ncbi:MAG: phosphate ABC transporter substrate-binding protein [bacterium]|nr:phosphate ABC transporter substrate-binding protein [bacterium]
MKKYAIYLLALGALCLILIPSSAQEKQSYVVIVNAENPATSLSKKRVSRLLLKEISRWDAHAAEPVDLDSKSKVREAFSKEIHGRSVSSIKNYWQRQIFSGKAVPPPEVATDAAVISFVKARPGGIGYVSAQTRLPSDVKVLTVASK